MGAILNGTYYDDATSECAVGVGDDKVEVYSEICESNYEDERDPQDVPGAGGDSLGLTVGPYKAGSPDFSMYKAKGQQFIDRLDAIAAPLGKRYGDLFIRLLIRYRLPGEPIHEDKIVGRIVKVADSRKAGDGAPIVTKFTMKATQVLRNGKQL